MSVPLSGHCYRYWHCSALVDPATLPQFWLCAAAAHLSIVLKQNSCCSCNNQLQMVSSLKCGTLKIVFPRLLVARWRREQSCYFDGLLAYEAKQASHSTQLQVTLSLTLTGQQPGRKRRAAMEEPGRKESPNCWQMANAKLILSRMESQGLLKQQWGGSGRCSRRGRRQRRGRPMRSACVQEEICSAWFIDFEQSAPLTAPRTDTHD